MATTSPNMDLSESRGPLINAIAWIFTGIAIATVALKLFARAHIVKRVGWDDFFIFFSMVTTCLFNYQKKNAANGYSIGAQHYRCSICLILRDPWAG